ncbi:MAG TPA: hypothetical protein VIL00_01075 [Pseudonocardiaceae bacterium]
MSVEITAGPPPDTGGSIGPEAAEAVRAAQAVLSRRVGATVRLAEAEDLGGSTRSVVVRVRVVETPFTLPRTLVIKHYLSSQGTSGVDPFAHEAASCQLFTALPPTDRVGPELVAHDPEKRLVVLEDLGWGPTLEERLFGDDSRAAERALLGWARALGRLHATTAGREADFEALLRRLGHRGPQDLVSAQAARAVHELPEILAGVLSVPVPPAVLERAEQAVGLLGNTRFRAFSPSEVCAENCLVTSRGVRFLDFEWGCVRDVALDAACFWVPFPSCWSSFAFPPGMAEAMLAAWQAEITSAWPELTDEVLEPRLMDAELLWVWLLTWWFFGRGSEPEHTRGERPSAEQRALALVDRWERLARRLAPVCPASADHAQQVAAALRTRCAVGNRQAPLYPAFR